MQPTDEQFAKEGDYMASVRYATEQTKMAKLSEVTLEYRKNGYGTANNSEEFVDEIACCPFVKCEEWSKEEEVRYVRIRERNMLVSYSENGGRFSYPQDKKCVKYRDKNGRQVPYLDIVFPKLSLEGILIGKQFNFETTEKTIKTLLQQTGYKNISVEQLMY